MAINSYGYPDTIAPGSIMAQFSGHGFGHRYSVIGFSDFRVTAASSGTRMVNIGDGWAMGKGVMVNNTAPTTYNLPAPSGTSQWMLVGLKRWEGASPYTSIITHVLGTTSRAVPSVTQTAGSNDTQWLALCRVTSADALVQDVVDLRLVSTEGAGFYTVFSDLAMDQLNNMVGAEVYRADTTGGHEPTFYKRVAQEAGTLAWKNQRVPETVIEGNSFVDGSAEAGWGQIEAEERLVCDGSMVWAHIVVEKSGGQITATSAGSLGDNEGLLTLDPAWHPPFPVSGTGFVTSDAGVERDAGIRMNSVGFVQVTSVTPGAVVRRVTADLIYSIA